MDKLLYLYVVLARLQAAVSGTGKCSYTREYKMLGADCFNQGFQEIPRNLNRDIEILYAAQNRIRSLTNSSLQEYSSLRYLYLGDNFITRIEPRAFSELGELEVLDLSKNALRNLPADLPPLLRKLYLAENEELQNISLSATFYLNFLNLAKCGLTQIPNLGMLPNLKELNMSANPLVNVAPKDLATLCRLEVLYLPPTLYNQKDSETQCHCHRLLAWTTQRYISLPAFNCTPLEDPDSAGCNVDMDEEIRLYKACQVAIPASTTRHLLIAVLAGSTLLATLIIVCWWRKSRRKKNSVQDQKRGDKKIEKNTKAADTLIT